MSMESAPVDIASVISELSAALKTRQKPRVDAPDETIALLAVIPSLPEEAAAMGIPGPEGALTGSAAIGLLDNLAENGLLDSVVAGLPWTGKLYRMSPRQRRIAIASLETRSFTGGFDPEVPSKLFEAARRRLEKPFPPAIEKWRELVTPGTASEDEIARRLETALDRSLLEARSLHLDTSPDAAAFLDAAEPLAATLGGTVRVAYARGQRALELYQRRSSDFRALSNYLKREELDDALNTLISQDNYWALHYVGVGGAGKTMFLRHVEAQLSSDRNLCPARVDFDHLNPNYPLRMPGLLLLGFAEELRLSAPEAAVDCFRKLYMTVAAVHHELEDAQKSGREVLLGFDAPLFTEALQSFVEGLSIIQQSGRRPVLILDTCEELARITPDHGLPRTVTETFRILEATHRGCGAVRVIFSGRRALASAGPGWRINNAEMPPRDYLMLCPIAGFSELESRRFLQEYGNRSEPPRPVPPRFYDAILALSAETEVNELAAIRAVPTEGAVEIHVAEGRVGKRHNPYDIDLFANWAASGDAGFSPEDFDDRLHGTRRQGARRHYYVRERIVARVREDLARWLPSLVVLGRFDEELIAELSREGDAFAALWAEIRRQEWVDVDRGTAIESDKVPLPFWNLDRKIRDRLEAYYADEFTDEWREARRRAVGILPAWTLERGWDLLSPSYFDLCVRLLASDGVKAADWWSKVERRILDDQAWDWADKITSALMSPESPKLAGPDGTHALQASIYALRANVVMRQSPQDERLDELWRLVEETLASYPHPSGQNLLAVRAIAGLIARARYRAQKPDAPEDLAQIQSRIGDFLRGLDGVPGDPTSRAQAVYCVCATLENVAEIQERLTREEGAAFQSSLSAILSDLAGAMKGQDLEPYAQMCLQRTCFGALRVPEYWDREPRLPEIAAFDWIPPKDLFARQLLEWSRLFELQREQAVSAFLSNQKVMRFIANVSPVRNLDQDRLISQAFRLGGNAKNAAEDRTPVAASLALADAREECQAHRVVPPYYATVIQLIADDGYVDSAAEKLNLAREGQTSTSKLRWLNGLSTYINRRFRLAEPEANAFEIPIALASAHNDVTAFLTAAGDALAELEKGGKNAGVERVRQTATPLAKRLGIQIPSVAADLARIPPSWQPWFARYLLILQDWGPKPNVTERTEIRKALTALYPTGQTPGDIAFAFKPQKSREGMYLAIGISAIVLIAAAAIWGGISLVGKVVAVSSGRRLPWYWDAVILVCSVFAMYYAARLLRWSMRITGKFLPVTFQVQRSADAERRIQVAARSQVVYVKPYVREMSAIADYEPYAPASAPFGPESKPNRFIAAIKRMREIRATILIQEDDLAGPCWEALIGIGRWRTNSVSSPFVFRRTTANSQRLVSRFPGELALLIVSPTSTGRFPAKAVTGPTSLRSKLDEDTGHDTGILILQTDIGLLQNSIRFSSGKGYATTDDILRRMPYLRLCVLINMESGAVKARSSVDRIASARARMAAHELFINGVSAVVTIPSLPAKGDLSNRALSILAAAVNPVPNVRDALQMAVQEIRKMIFKESGLEPADSAELAYDVCYYATDVINMQSDPTPMTSIRQVVRK